MVSRMRIWDLLTVAGFLVLLFQVPSYLAVDDEEAITQRHSYDFPAPRAGDRIAYEAWVDSDGMDPVVFGPVQEVRVRMVREGEIPVGALYVVEKELFAVDRTFDWGAYRQDHTIERTYYDEAGLAVWQTAHQASDGGWRVSERGAWFDLTDDWWNMHGLAGSRVFIEPDVGGAILSDLAHNGVSFMLSGFSEDWTEDVFSVYSARANGFLLHEYPGSPQQALDDEPRRQGWGTTAERWGPLTTKSDEGGMRTQYYPLWDERLPFPAAWRVDFSERRGAYAVASEASLEGGRQDAPVGTIWTLPTEIERGAGPDLPVHRYKYRGWSPSPTPEFQERLPALPTMTMAALWQDPRPLAFGVGMAHLHDAARDARLASERQVGRDAVLLDWFWADNGTEPLPAEPPIQADAAREVGRRAGLGHEDTADAVRAHRSTWLTTWADPSDGSVDVFRFVFRSQPTGVELVSAEALCAQDRPTGTQEMRWKHCHTVPPELTDGQRRVVAPWAIEQRHAELPTADTAGHPQAGAFVTSVHRFSYSGSRIAEQWAVLRPSGLDLGRNHHIDDDLRLLDGFAAHWMSDAEDTGRWQLVSNLRDGRPERMAWQGDDESETTTLTPTRAATTDPIQVVPRVSDRLVTGSIALALVGLGARLGAWLAGGGAFPAVAALFSRIEKDKALNHERRATMVDLARAEPGITATEIARRTGWGWGAVVHHLETLERNGLVTHVQHGRRRCFFAVGEASPTERRRTACLAHPQEGPFLAAVEAEPGLSLPELVDALGQDKTGASRTGSRLARMGLVRKERDGRLVRYFPTATT